jgi:hypothetical protein
LKEGVFENLWASDEKSLTDITAMIDEPAFFSLLISLRYALIVPFSAYHGSSSILEL